MTPLMTLAFLMLGTPLTHEGRLGEGPAVAPRRYRWTVGRSAFCFDAFACVWVWGCARGISTPSQRVSPWTFVHGPHSKVLIL